MTDFAATKQPEINETRYFLLRTRMSVYGEFDPRFANYDLHPLPPGTNEDAAFDTATILADEDGSYLVLVGKWTATGSVDGVAKMRIDEARRVADELKKAKT
jgi:hypothetical protein